ncbi:MAG TPA: c-type cytochrome biogenesis protein CcsB [Pseudonocardiaceae bacterium]
MPVNEALAQYSNWTYTSAVAIYVLAMFFYLAEQAFGRSRAAATAATATSRTLITVGPGGELIENPAEDLSDESESGPAESTDSVPPRPPSDTTSDTTSALPGQRSLPERLGRMGVSLTVLGVGFHLMSIVLRGLSAHRWPLGNMYEFMSFVCLIAMIAWLVMLRRFAIRRLGAFVLLPVVVLMFLGGTVLYTQAAPLEPALQSYWLTIHVTVISAASGILLVPGVASLLYLLRGAYDRNPARFTRLGPKLPSVDTLDRLAYRMTIFGFPLFTFGIICGAIWAESAWGRYWGWDPKETTAFVAWVIYAGYLHARATAGWRGSRAAVINIIGLAVMIFNLFFVNLVITGLHSYAGVG